jgi:hypothetical protein
MCEDGCEWRIEEFERSGSGLSELKLPETSQACRPAYSADITSSAPKQSTALTFIGVVFVPNFVKIRQVIRKLKVGQAHGQT